MPLNKEEKRCVGGAKGEVFRYSRTGMESLSKRGGW
jgi:hypothetical protein